MSDLNRDPEEVARERGRVVIYPEPDQLILDFDSPTKHHGGITDEETDENEWRFWYYTLLGKLRILYRNGIAVVVEDIIRSSSPGCRHVFLRFHRALSDWERIGFQAALGSDGWREIMSLARLESFSTVPATVSFEDGGFVAEVRRLARAGQAKEFLNMVEEIGPRELKYVVSVPEFEGDEIVKPVPPNKESKWVVEEIEIDGVPF